MSRPYRMDDVQGNLMDEVTKDFVVYFSEHHEWAKVNGNVATIGITDHSEHLMGEFVHVELPSKGDTFEAGEVCGSIESVKAAIDLFAIVGGEVTQVNENLADYPELVNHSPRGEGWLIKMKMTNPHDLNKLMDASQYKAFVERKRGRRMQAVNDRAHLPRILRSNAEIMKFNVAVEEHFAREGEVRAPLLLIWRSTRAILVGRNQNPWVECDIPRLDEDGVYLARRHTGGGAVFVDLGTTVFTFISPCESFDIDRNFDIVQASLKKHFGIDATKQGRNDLVVGEKKVSGSAFQRVRDTCLHHGTILLDLNMTALPKYLTPSKLKLQAKGLKNAASRVMNLVDLAPSIDHDGVCNALADEFRHSYLLRKDVVHIEPVTETSLFASASFKREHDAAKSWAWRFGQTPKFSHEFETRIDGQGMFTVHLDISSGRIKDVVVFSDSIYPEVVDRITSALKQRVRYTREDIQRAFLSNRHGLEGPGLRQLDEFTDWLLANVEVCSSGDGMSGQCIT